MNIPETFHFDKDGEVVERPWIRRFFLTMVIILVALLSFGIGRLSGGVREGVSVNFDPSLLTSGAQVASVRTEVTGQEVEASSQGTRYYYSHCGNNISEKNKVTFATALLAEEAGYVLALNCKKP